MATAEVAEVAAEAAEVVAEEATEFAEAARGFTGRELGFLAVGTVWGVACGCVAGYFLVKGRLESKYEKVLEEEMSKAREYCLGRMEKTQVVVEDKPDLDEVVAGLGYKENGRKVAYDKVEGKVVQEEATPKPELANVFESPQPEQEETEPDWDWAAEVKSRTDQEPFIIHRDEWNAGEMDYEQMSLTYFEGDDVLINDLDKVIEDQDSVIGLSNMLKWGHGAGDPNMLFIRNPVLGMDLEVTRSMGSYASEVHGIEAEDELTHSGHRVRPRRRFDDGERS